MNIIRLSVEIYPPTFLDPQHFKECRIEVVADNEKFTFIEVVSKDDFVSYFDRLMEKAKFTIKQAIEEHKHYGIKSPKSRRSRKSS